VQMQDLQTRVQGMEMDGTAGGGAVTCRMTGKFELRNVKISPDLVKAGDVEMLEDLIVAAVNDARAKAEKTMNDETQKLMRDMGLPPGLDLPF